MMSTKKFKNYLSRQKYIDYHNESEKGSIDVLPDIEFQSTKPPHQLRRKISLDNSIAINNELKTKVTVDQELRRSKYYTPIRGGKEPHGRVIDLDVSPKERGGEIHSPSMSRVDIFEKNRRRMDELI
eukprot:CAMPEP_0170507922 /NCGR_PEP_ID=MMETSP0208-20121228/60593_1 /TAXON_ID=197538 /ORGANISM="Strombidium inclinatum, Strain S3" /LENGTH=126 /DNA_ID=CAMNT_0010790475 /DNA_START=441 /DNA_END=821 /DNA_ORIENTATION=+